MTPVVLTPEQVAEILQVSEDVVRDLKEQGRLPFVQLSRQRWRVPEEALREWLLAEADASLVHLELEHDGVDIPGISGRRGAA